YALPGRWARLPWGSRCCCGRFLRNFHNFRADVHNPSQAGYLAKRRVLEPCEGAIMGIYQEGGLPVLSCGKHNDPRDGACLMEYVSVLAGEKFSDRPSCTDRLLSHLAR